jgi:nicotinate-nucleotide adenylyltransferase
MEKVKTGLFFGTFNPVHIGHTAIANYILEYSDLSEIWFVVSPQNPFKKGVKLISEHFRLEMTKLAISQEARFKVSDVEFHLPKPSYTFDSLEELKRDFSKNKFILLMGNDNILHLSKWKYSDRIIGDYDIIVYPRPGYPISENDLPMRTQLINAPLLDISSTMIRNSFAEGKKLPYFLSPAVFDFIEKKELYRQ